jgi:hypothetical protein
VGSGSVEDHAILLEGGEWRLYNESSGATLNRE